MKNQNPFLMDDKWYFFDETDTDHGPYVTCYEANEALQSYVYWLQNRVSE